MSTASGSFATLDGALGFYGLLPTTTLLAREVEKPAALSLSSIILKYSTFAPNI
jgi:hypothetical protein